MNSLEITKRILNSNKIIAKKCFGQNFLIDDSVLQNIVSSSNVKPNDTVIEIGPGLGNLTYYLLEKGASVLAFEIDQNMIDVLKKRYADNDRLTVINQDILKVNLKEYIGINKKVKIIANLPYYITTPIIFKLLENRAQIESITIMIQKEVAERITAKSCSKDYGVLTINTNVLAETEKLFDVKKESFIPEPSVTSSVISIKPSIEKEEMYNILDENIFKEVVKKAFLARRKKMINSLVNNKVGNMDKIEIENMLKSLDIDLNRRAEEVDIEDFVKIANYIVKEQGR